MDERVRLSSHVSGGHFFKVAATVVSELGQEGLAREILARGVDAGELGVPVRRGRFWEIPVRVRERDE